MSACIESRIYSESDIGEFLLCLGSVSVEQKTLFNKSCLSTGTTTEKLKLHTAPSISAALQTWLLFHSQFQKPNPHWRYQIQLHTAHHLVRLCLLY